MSAAKTMGNSVFKRGEGQVKELSRKTELALNFAEGWLLLGDAAAAEHELDQVEAEFRMHPSVLAMRWQVYTALQWGEAAWVIAKALCEIAPRCAAAWVCQGNSLCQLKGPREA